ncbi:molybdopterin-dependent oxidoreductase [Paraburkholderia caffeinilytica]|uniref:molybdopterin-dependent oxidoreductase n=1 Tax=Paraburkholderia caffeinilytica TaxID=1761016 RepID=UPI0038BB8CDE
MLKPLDTDCVYINDAEVPLPQDLSQGLAVFLRDELHLRGTKLGCNAGDCGSCSVIVDGVPVYSCIVPVGQVAGRHVVTTEGLADCTRSGRALQEAFLAHQAVQCGFCIPGMLCTAAAAIDAGLISDESDARSAISGVLCRCTGYQKPVQAICAVARGGHEASDCKVRKVADIPRGEAVGAAVVRLDGREKVTGEEAFGADGIPADALMLKAIRSPHHHAQFEIDDLAEFLGRYPGIRHVFVARDVPGLNLHGVAGPYADQPVLAERETRFLGEAVALVMGDAHTIRTNTFDDFPVTWRPLASVLDIEEALRADAPQLHESRSDNTLIRGHVSCGDVAQGFAQSDVIVEGAFTTSFVEHAYLEPEAGWARRTGNILEVWSPTQAPHAHRLDLEKIIGDEADEIRVIPTAVGGGFGGKLDMTVQPFVALAAWLTHSTVGMVYSREESIATSTKRHPAHIHSRIGATADGRLQVVEFRGEFNTGSYASWGTAVANRVPVHASGPYKIDHYTASTRAVHTHVTAAGAFRGFGVPQTALAQEQLIDALARRLDMDRLEFRIRNAIRPGESLVTGQVLPDSVGIGECLEAVKPRWQEALAEAAAFNASQNGWRRGVGLAAMMYGCGNTAMSNPSTIRMGVDAKGRVFLHQGAVDAGQGANTVIPQIAADALGIRLHALRRVGAATHITPDCGRTSASRQTFVTGKAAQLAGSKLKSVILDAMNILYDAQLEFNEGSVCCGEQSLELDGLPVNSYGYVFMAEEKFDPPSTGLDQKGQGSPYAVYAFGVHLAEVEVDMSTGVTRVLRVTAAHDVGRAVNPALLEGQVEGAVAQGVGMALMEKFVPGVNNNLHDYLIPTCLDMPVVETILVEEPTAVGPYGAKGIGEPSLVPGPAAILNAIGDAIGQMVPIVPATPEVVLGLLNQNRCSWNSPSFSCATRSE